MWSTAVTRLQSRSDVKGSRLTPIEIEAYTAVLLETEAQPPAVSANHRSQCARRLDGDATARNMMALRTDQDATHDLIDAWRGMQQLHQTIASQTSRRATASVSMPTRSSTSRC